MRVENGSEGQQRRLLCNRRPIQVYSGSGSGYHIPRCALEALSRSPSWPSRSIPYPVPYRRRATKYNNGMDDSEVGAGGWGLTAFATTADHFSVAFSTKWRGDGVDLPLPSCLSLFTREHLSLPTMLRRRTKDGINDLAVEVFRVPCMINGNCEQSPLIVTRS